MSDEDIVVPIVLPGPASDRETAHGWVRWRTSRHAFIPAPRLTSGEYGTLSPRKRNLYDLHRVATHANLAFQETPMGAAVSKAMWSRQQRPARQAHPRQLVATVRTSLYEHCTKVLILDDVSRLRWMAAAGLAVDADAFHPTVLVGMRNRLRASARPRRLHEDVRAVARQAGLLLGRKRVIDSTPLYDAVATQDTVTQLRAAVGRLLMLADRHDPALAAAVRAVLARDDDYATAGKPPCD